MDANIYIEQKAFLDAMRSLMQEAYIGPQNPKGTWFVDNEADCGFAGIVDRVSALQASKIVGYPAGSSIASHTNHVRFALNLVNRAVRGEDAYKNADWSGSWKIVKVNDIEWDKLRDELRKEYEELIPTLVPGPQWTVGDILTGAIATVAHGAWHLGAVRQLAVLV